MRRRSVFAVGLLAASATALAGEASHHWGYAGLGGPSHWAELDPKFAACGSGKSQSPIDIRTHDVHGQKLPALDFDYRPGSLHIIDNGHTIQVDVERGSSLRVGDKRYQLVQFHFHHPSEERIDGKAAEMVVHLVHRDAGGKLAVVAILLDPGKSNAMIGTLWKHVPNQKEHEAEFDHVPINPAALLPPNRSYFTYTGSLTTPPCSEGVRWIILKSRSSVSKAEIAGFAGHYHKNARPVQQLNGRQVLAAT